MKNSNKKHKVIAVIGTRPEAIKMAPIIRAMHRNKAFDVAVCATGQHTDMMFPILDWFGISRDYTLDVMRHQQPLSHLAGRLLSGLHDVIEDVAPDIIMVQGDTTSAFIGALATYYSYDHFWKNQLRNTPMRIAHIEAGLRTGDNYSPYPEEVNRRLIGHMSHWNFAPTEQAAEALKRESITQNVFVTGNTVIDALFETRDMLAKKPLNPVANIPQSHRIVLVTSHRRENYGEGLQEICKAVRQLAKKYVTQNVQFVYPVHLNQHVQSTVREALADIDNVHLIKPLDYPEFVALMQRSYLVLTDSGGVQEEAPSLGKPVLVMRDNTERPEAVLAGTAKLVGAKSEQIITHTIELLDNDLSYAKMAKTANPYGDGKASNRIINILSGKHSTSNNFEYKAA
ncbi:MAG: non-hydrolyzing UDP-N-acetylglucosamine 2-epimerase [Alphaproteobacteria bacterium]